VSAPTVTDIDTIRTHIRMLDDAEARGDNVTRMRAYWCQKAVDWAKAELAKLKGGAPNVQG
jgi:hypothetical protein